MRSHPWCIAALAVLLVATGCAPDLDPPLDQEPQPYDSCFTVADSVGESPVPISCGDWRDCPPGATCDLGGQCALTREIAEQLFTVFLRAPEFPLTLTATANGPALEWTPPPGTQTVFCTLWGCLPELTFGENNHVENSPVCGLARRAFVDGETRAVLEPLVFDDRLDSIELGDGAPNAAGSATARACWQPAGAVETSLHLAASALGASCFAYDDTSLLGVTRIIRLSTADILPALPFWPESCAEQAQGGTCPLFASQTPFGMCDGGQCCVPCLSDQQCGDGDRCVSIEGALVGVCENQCEGA